MSGSDINCVVSLNPVGQCQNKPLGEQILQEEA